MSDSRAAAMDRAYAELAAFECTADSMDGLVEVTVGAHGDLRGVHLDPRVSRSRDADALAGHILAAAAGAAALAVPQAARAAAALLPPRVDPAEADLVFDPLLHELDRLIDTPRSHRHGVDGDPLPIIQADIDYEALRHQLLARRDHAEHARQTAASDDGLIDVTVDARCRLLGLFLHQRVLLANDSRLLARQVTATTHRAAGLIRERVWS